MKDGGFDYLIIAGGQPPDNRFLKALRRDSKHLITVDRGAQVSRRLHWAQDLHVGDNDSIDKKTLLQILPETRISLPKKKSISDLEYALTLVPKQTYKVIVGANQDHEGRTDHVAVNLLLAQRYSNIFLADEKIWIAGLRNNGISFRVPKKTTFSVLPLHEKAKVSIRGSDYDVNSADLPYTSTGLSNLSKASQVSVKVRGPALLFVSSNITKTPFKYI